MPLAEINITNLTTEVPYEYQNKELNLYYAVCEVLVAIFAVVGNALVIYVFQKDRKLRRRTNYYIVSLATADFLVGLLGIPFAILSSVGLPTNLHACLFTVSLLVVLCTISIFCLVAVSVDRYWAILHPMGYSRNVRTKTALVIISICWFAGSIVGFLPLLGWHGDGGKDKSCFFLNVMDLNYLVFLYFGTIITPALLLAAFYAHIYQVVIKQANETNSNYEPRERLLNERLCLWRGMIRTLGVQQTNEVKATQNLSIIVLFFMICWIPLYTINCILAFRPDFQVNSTFMLCCIILSHLNSAGNPLLYAYHLRDFRAALKHFFCGLFNHRRYCERINRNTNYGQCTSQLRAKSRSSNNYNFNNTKNYKRNLLTSNKMSVIVKKTTDVASATAGEVNGGIWNISENSASSSDSMKSLDSHIQEKILMIRPATPYRPRNLSEINPVYMITTCEDESDDGFNEEETLPYHDYTLDECEVETCLSERLKKPKIVSRNTKRFSFSSPQISDELFVVEDNVDKENNKTVSLSLREPKKTLGLSVSDRCSRSFPCPFKVVNILRSKKELCRSLSDGGSVSLKSFTPNGKVKFTDT